MGGFLLFFRLCHTIFVILGTLTIISLLRLALPLSVYAAEYDSLALLFSCDDKWAMVRLGRIKQ